MPRGIKTCPGCKGEVRGPRTLTCPDCNYQFGVKAIKPPVAARRAAAIATPKQKVETVKPVEPELQTVSNDATYDIFNQGIVTVVRRYANGISRASARVRAELMEYINNVDYSVDNQPVMPSQTFFA